MAKFEERVSQKAALSPGTPIYIGPRKAEEVTITVLEYDKESYREKVVEKPEDLEAPGGPATVWVNVVGVHQVEVVKKLGNRFGLHPLVVEDILNTKQRPKVEEYAEYLYMAFKILSYDEKHSRISASQASIVLGTNYVLTFQENKDGTFDPVKRRIENGKGRIRTMGADYLAYALVDTVVDEYYRIGEQVGEDIEFLEEEVISGPSQRTLAGIHDLRKQLMLFRRSVWPLREIVSGLEQGESAFLKRSTLVYLKDVYDHIAEIIETVESYRDMISELLDTYMSSVSYRLNDVMRVLTIIATIFIPLTFIVGVYGMNFKYMPELSWRWGYPVVWLIMILISVSMLACFRKRKWL
ncbi:MAG: magnesium/cobalt transporter CorA [Thermoanaerobacterales bacterium]|nr:magnesium/cobalt transporter CorA [Bacillota bacterium]MDI6907183.1 magnesium/cobalt transporter CorA [Thermoanaerobacterales bacterium]